MTHRIRLLMLFGVLALATPTEAALLFDRAATWRWRPGTNEASSRVTPWRLSVFNDSEAVTAPAAFWYDLTGDSSTLVAGTQISGLQKVYYSLVLRRTFVVPN